jgi:hypothetical protein
MTAFRSQRPIATGRYHAPLAEKTADELLLHVRKNEADAEECYLQLRQDGWTEAQIVSATDTTLRD